MSDTVKRGSHAVDLPGAEVGPLRKILRRLAIGLGLIVMVAGVAYAGRDGYIDPEGGGISLLDAFYYATVSITTTGYGDIIPASDGARLTTTLVVTPARVLFLILLVGTTLEILAERSREAYRLIRWRKRLRDHTIICGYGVKGRAATRTLLGKGLRPERIVAIEPDAQGRSRASADGVAVVAGSADRQEVLREAGIEAAEALVVAPDRDDTAVLIALTARQMNPDATIVAAVREEENVQLLHQSGADAVITSSGAAGRLLGLSARTPQVTEVMEDLMTVGEGLDINERVVGTGEAGPTLGTPGAIVLAVVRDGEVIRFDDDRARTLHEGDRVLELFSHRN